MTISLSEFLAQLAANPVLAVTVALTLGVVLVNGWTDAPNAIATCVSTRAMSARSAILMAAVFNFLGVLVMTMVNASVAATIYNMVDFGGNTADALTALCAALVAIVAWATAAWWFGIPTSESHALIAGTMGAAYALNQGAGIHLGGLMRVLAGLVLSLVLGYLLGWGVQRLFLPWEKHLGDRFYVRGEVGSAALMAFCHGAQDGQKFAAVFLIADWIARGLPSGRVELAGNWQVVALTALVMALGTYTGGGRIIRKVGEKMVRLDHKSALYSDLAGSISLLLTTLWGLPVSTTHTKTAAVLGVGGKTADRRVFGQMVFAWLLTFPACGALGYFCTLWFLSLL